MLVNPIGNFATLQKVSNMKLYTDGKKVVRATHKAQAFDMLQEIYCHPDTISDIVEIPTEIIGTAMACGSTLSEIEHTLESHAFHNNVDVRDVVRLAAAIMEAFKKDVE